MGPVGCPETLVTNTLHCVTSQKSEDLIYVVQKPEIMPILFSTDLTIREIYDQYFIHPCA